MKLKKRQSLLDAIDFIRMGSRALFKDDFTKCFRPIKPGELNGSGIFYIFSLLIRYFFLLPYRILWFIGGSGIFFILFIKAIIKNDEKKIAESFLFYCKVFVTSFGARIKHFGNKRKLHVPHVFVANHTSFLDYLVLSSHKFAHASVAESHGGLFGFLYKSILTKNGSLLFKRSDRNDRTKVLGMIKEHVAKNKASMLIFPEGTCVNNKYSVLYQKGAFDLEAVVCPVAIKYRKNLLDPYWNTSKHTFFIHLLYLMSRWKLDVEVHWLPPRVKLEGEIPADFAMRVKRIISKKIGLKDVIWNGYFKSAPVLKDREILKEAFIKVYNKHARLESDFIDSSLPEENKKREKKWENIYKEIVSDPEDEYYFYGFNYRKYLDHSLKEYCFLKNNPQKLAELQKEKEVIFQTDQLLWLTQPVSDDNPTPCNCFKKVKKKVNKNQSKKALNKDKANKEITKFY
ncbi:1-acyl-sn-glycerol-3-phosphate acyltransferase [Tubulinosema ratisbonensis]|uniref:1-acyl-sn-glycerol-3-phosphate acyltransferase n=1 Tax=Tubulinosema ratisbonensis TaxID=291195 RepID=A0A437ALH7_9MICR|nr:1-acyl-sn-glycerol-3-phosphate acyltransferase [Tubulinosema ratisbonensis]